MNAGIRFTYTSTVAAWVSNIISSCRVSYYHRANVKSGTVHKNVFALCEDKHDGCAADQGSGVAVIPVPSPAVLLQVSLYR